MKKMILIIAFVVSNNMSYTYQDEYVDQKENVAKSHHNSFVTGDQSSDEYQTQQDDIDEYDQHVCDDVELPKISAAKALLTEVLGALLIRYITMREVARIYFKDFKDVINKWFNSIVKP